MTDDRRADDRCDRQSAMHERSDVAIFNDPAADRDAYEQRRQRPEDLSAASPPAGKQNRGIRRRTVELFSPVQVSSHEHRHRASATSTAVVATVGDGRSSDGFARHCSSCHCFVPSDNPFARRGIKQYKGAAFQYFI